MALSEFGVDLALYMQRSVHHEGTKDTKVSDSLNSELRALRAFVVNDCFFIQQSTARHRQIMGPFAEPFAAVGGDDDGVAPGTERLAVGGRSLTVCK